MTEESSTSSDDRQQSHEGEHHGDYGSTVVPITRSVRLYTLCAAMNSLNLGYDIGVSTNLGPLIQDDFGLTDVEREILIGSLNFFAMWGALASSWFSDRFGRRTTFVVASFGFLNGLIVMATGQSYNAVFCGRVLVGLGVGVGFAIDPLYISEISPAKHRGELVTWSEIGVNVGILLGFSTGLLFENHEGGDTWRAMCLLGMVFPVAVMFVTVGILPETPRWYVLNGADNDARLVLKDIYPKGFNVDLVIHDIKEALERERLAEESTGWSVVLFPTPAIRRMLFIGLLVPFAQQAAGIDAIQYYLLDLMQNVGITESVDQKIFLIGLGIVKLTFIVISSRLLDAKGRRFVLFLSLTGIIIALLTLSISFTIPPPESSIVAMTGLSLFLASYGIGLGPVAWLLPSEIFATCIRAKGVSLATFINRGMATLMVAGFLTVKNTISWPTFFLILAFVTWLALSLLYCYLPETKGRSLEDMTLYFAEETNDFSILDAERKLRVENEIVKMKDGTLAKKHERMADESGVTASVTSRT